MAPPPELIFAAARNSSQKQVSLDDGFLAAVWQGVPVLRDRRANLELVLAAVLTVPSDLELLVFPELFLQGYDIGIPALRSLAIPCPSSLTQLFASVHAEPPPHTSIALAVPYAESDNTGSLFNSVAIFHHDGALAHNYRKCHLWDDGNSAESETYERAVFAPGGVESLCGFDLRLSSRTVRTGCLICFDIEFPEPARILAVRDGIEVLLVPTALATGPLDRVTPLATIPARALENHVHVLYANFAGCGAGGTLMFCGRSGIVGPDGLDLTRAAENSINEFGALFLARICRTDFMYAICRNDYLVLRRPHLYGMRAVGHFKQQSSNL